MTLILTLHDRVELVPYVLRYYTRMGVTRIVYALCNGIRHPVYAQVAALSGALDWHVRPTVLCSESDYAYSETDGLNEIRREFVEPEEWYVLADADEFHYYDGKSLAEAAAMAERAGFRCVQGEFRDRFAADGALPVIQPERTLDEQFPTMTQFTRWMGACYLKVSLCQGGLPIRSGHHECDEVSFPFGYTHHFKWVSGIKEILKSRHERQLAAHINWAWEQAKALSLLETPDYLSDPKCKSEPASQIGV